jgi:molybdenum cofactor cytidylyltransferase
MDQDISDFTGVILAAGSSRRMGKPKPLLGIDGEIFINRILANMSAAGLTRILIVLGEHAGAVRSALAGGIKAGIVINPAPEHGQLSSIQSALDQVDPTTTGVLLVLVDHPLVRGETYRQILETAVKDPDRIIIPNYHGRNGHPVYFGRKFFSDLKNAPLDQGARYVVNKYRSEVIAIPVEDDGILKDIDDPELYKKYISGVNNGTG